MLNIQQLQFSVHHRLAMTSNDLSLPQSRYGPSNLCLRNLRPSKISSLRTGTKTCKATLQTNSTEFTEETRRNSDFHPTIWDHQLIESFTSPYTGHEFEGRIEALKQEVRELLQERKEPVAKLELIDKIRRLGLGYHFDNEIESALAQFSVDGLKSFDGLMETALCFKLLREDRHFVSTDVFKKFTDGQKFMDSLSQDIKGLLSLYEASHLAFPDEDILEEAREFSLKHLECLRDEGIDPKLAEEVRHSLEAPTHWLIPRVEVRRFIDIYEKEEGNIPCLLKLAKLDFNVVQALHQREIKELSRWWKDLGLATMLGFTRDRIFENYLWGLGNAYEPELSKCRKVITQLISVLNIIDDFYDTYGTLEEVEQFTTAIRRWDLKAMEGLPHYLKLCYFGLYNFVNVTAYDFLRDFGYDIRHLLAKEWICLCESWLKEAQWYHRRKTPPLEEYLENGWTSIGGPILVFHGLYYIGDDFSKESLDHSERGHKLIRLSSLLIRLIDDLTPSKAEEKGAVTLSIQCRMKESGESYETSKKYTEGLIRSYWKELNKEALECSLSRNFIYVTINSIRSSFHIFQYGDGIGDGTGVIKDLLQSLVVDPIPMG